MGYLKADGRMNATILPLMQGLLAVSIAVVVIVLALVVVGAALRFRPGPLADVPIGESPSTAWITIGLAISTPVLLALVVWTSITMARIANPPTEPELTIEVRGHQWWWEFVYHNHDPSQDFRDGERASYPCRQAGAFRSDRSRRHPYVLGSQSRRQDPDHPRSDQRHLARGGQARRLPRPVLAVLRRAARPHDSDGRRRSSRGLRTLETDATPQRSHAIVR